MKHQTGLVKRPKNPLRISNLKVTGIPQKREFVRGSNTIIKSKIVVFCQEKYKIVLVSHRYKMLDRLYQSFYVKGSMLNQEWYKDSVASFYLSSHYTNKASAIKRFNNVSWSDFYNYGKKIGLGYFSKRGKKKV